MAAPPRVLTETKAPGWTGSLSVLSALTAAVVMTIAGTACDADEPGWAVDADGTELRSLEENGFRLNGFQLNGFRLNGFRLNGARLDGDSPSDWIELHQIVVPGHAEIVESWLVGSDLHVKTKFGAIRSGTQLLNAELVFLIQEGADSRKSTVKITSVKPLAPESDVWLYGFDIKDESEAWHPLCVDSDDQPTQAILLRDAWDPDTGNRISPRPTGMLTIACRDAALAKCVEWGYAPWRQKDGVSLAKYHQTCTRAVRADYCGDGTPHTFDGNEIHVLDKLGIEKAEPGQSYAVEAEWGPGGAVCLNPDHTRLPGVKYDCSLPTCGDSFASGGLIQTGVPLP